MVSTKVDEASVLVKFDKLVKDGTVLYTPDLKKIHLTDGGFKFEFRLTSALKSKPAAVEGNSELESESPTPSNGYATHQDANIEVDADGCIPGGDISVTGFVIEKVNDTHVLMFNKFCAYRPHLMLLAADGHRRQFEALTRADLEAARGVLEGLGERYLAIFNCGKEGGCSRLHKHMQVIPAPADFGLWPDDAAENVPFRYFLRRFKGTVPPVDELSREYRGMLAEAAKLVPGRAKIVEKDQDGNEISVPHNVVLGRRWMVVVPRRAAGVDGADANAAGMLGMVWASGNEVFDKWKDLGPKWVLGEAGVRK